ncbi:MAG: sugar phosphate nucleotidyltransferase [Candidatus Helarchaeota archaeon]
MISVIILAAGKGSRLWSITKNEIPKCLVKIGNRTILDRLIENFVFNGITKIFVVVGHLGEMIFDYISNNKENFQFCRVIKSENFSKGPIFTILDAIHLLDKSEAYLLCPSDLIIDPKAVSELLKYYKENKNDLLVGIDTKTMPKGATVLIEGGIKEFGTINKFNFSNIKGNMDVKLVPIVIFSRNFIKYINLAVELKNTKFIGAMDLFNKDDNQIFYVNLTDYYWFDIDNADNLRKAKQFLLKIEDLENEGVYK